jgi:predicted pyridoxine 5'-phosphate oxidase superfamily flavin-nucleotide-binding protein
MPKEVMDLLAGRDRTVNQAIATVNADGIPNNAPLTCVVAIDSETIVFMDAHLVHTRENLQGKNKKIAISIWKGGAAYQVKGTFVEYLTSGPVYDKFLEARGMKGAKIKAGVVKVDEVYSQIPGQNSKKLV